jgi:hypothetical protein
MNDILLKYLHENFKNSNHPKYHKHFNEWLNNLTENQIYYYNKLWLKI